MLPACSFPPTARCSWPFPSATPPSSYIPDARGTQASQMPPPRGSVTMTMAMSMQAPPSLQLGTCRPSTGLGPPLRRPVQSQLPARFRFVPREKRSPPPRSISPSNPPAGQQSKIRRTIREGHSVREPCPGRQNLLPVPGSWAARFPDQHASRSKRLSASPASWALTLLSPLLHAHRRSSNWSTLESPSPSLPRQHSNSLLGTKAESGRSTQHTTTITHEHPLADSVRGDHSSTEAIATHSTATTQRETATRLVPPDDSRRPRSALPREHVLPLFSRPYLDPDTSEPDDSFPRPPSGPWRSVCLGTSGAQPSSIPPAFDRRFPRTIWTRYVSH